MCIRGAVTEKSNAAIVKHGGFEPRPSQTHSKLNMFVIMRGTVVEKSNTTIVKYVFFLTEPPQTYSKLNISIFIARSCG